MAGPVFRSMIKEAIPKLRGPARQQFRDLRQQLLGTQGLKKEQIDYALRSFKDPSQKLSRDELLAGTQVPEFSINDEANVFLEPVDYVRPKLMGKGLSLDDLDATLAAFNRVKKRWADAYDAHSKPTPDDIEPAIQLAMDRFMPVADRFGHTPDEMREALRVIAAEQSDRAGGIRSAATRFGRNMAEDASNLFHDAQASLLHARRAPALRAVAGKEVQDPDVQLVRKHDLVRDVYPYREYQRLGFPPDPFQLAEFALRGGVRDKDAGNPWNELGYSEKTLVTPDYTGPTGHYNTAGAIGHVRSGNYETNPGALFALFDEAWQPWHNLAPPEGRLIEELQSDAQKGKGQEGPLSQVHEALAKAAIVDALRSGDKQVSFPNNAAIRAARSDGINQADDYSAIYDQAVPRALRQVAKLYGLDLQSPATVAEPFYTMRFTPDVINDILKRGLPHFKHGGKVRKGKQR